MLRIFHSLPRAHKLLLLPVATMVTVLGTHKILAAFDDSAAVGTNKQVNLTLAVPTTAAETLAFGAPAPQQPVSSPAPQKVGQDIPLFALTTQEIVDIDFIDTAQAAETSGQGEHSVLQPRDVSNDAASQSVMPDQPPSTIAALDGKALNIALQMFDDSDNELAGGTSYEDLSTDPMILDGDEIELENELVAKEEFVPQWETYTVQKGDTFAVMAERTFGLGYSEVLRLLDNLPDDKALTNWRVGDNIDFQLDEEGQLLALRVMNDARTGYLIERDAEQHSFDVANIEKAGEATQRLFAGTVNGSFAGSASVTGLSYGEVAELSTLLSKKIDFRRNTRRGDHFQVLVEADMIEGKALDSRILQSMGSQRVGHD